MSRWELTKEVEDLYKLEILCFINNVQKVDLEEPAQLLELNLSDTELNPYTLCKLLETLGYRKVDQQDNGWQLDFWITMTHPKYRPLQVKGCGITFELILSEMGE